MQTEAASWFSRAPAAAYQHMLKKYVRCITANDQNVGRVLKYLDDHGLTDNTVVVYTSDQGYWLGPPAHWGVRTNRHKLVCFPRTEEIELYDLRKDAKEMLNVAGNPEYAEPIADCRKRLAKLIQEVDIKPEQMPKFRAERDVTKRSKKAKKNRSKQR